MSKMIEKRKYIYAITALQLGLLTGCAKPAQITTMKSSTPEIFYTVETYNGHGAVVADSTDVYAHLERNGKVDKKLVLGGEYLLITKAIWHSPTEVTLCMPDGLTRSFRNQVTLDVNDGSSVTIRTHLQEEPEGICPPRPTYGQEKTQ